MALPYITAGQAEKLVKEEIEKIPSPASSGLEVIEWDGERDFTKEEFEKLIQFKAIVKDGKDSTQTGYYIPTLYDDEQGDPIDNQLFLNFYSVRDDGIIYGLSGSLCIRGDGVFVEKHIFELASELQNYIKDNTTNLYKHNVSLSYSGGVSFIIRCISNIHDPITSLEELPELFSSSVNIAKVDDGALRYILGYSGLITYFNDLDGGDMELDLTSCSFNSDLVTDY